MFQEILEKYCLNPLFCMPIVDCIRHPATQLALALSEHLSVAQLMLVSATTLHRAPQPAKPAKPAKTPAPSKKPTRKPSTPTPAAAPLAAQEAALSAPAANQLSSNPLGINLAARAVDIAVTASADASGVVRDGSADGKDSGAQLDAVENGNAAANVSTVDSNQEETPTGESEKQDAADENEEAVEAEQEEAEAEQEELEEQDEEEAEEEDEDEEEDVGAWGPPAAYRRLTSLGYCHLPSSPLLAPAPLPPLPPSVSAYVAAASDAMLRQVRRQRKRERHREKQRERERERERDRDRGTEKHAGETGRGVHTGVFVLWICSRISIFVHTLSHFHIVMRTHTHCPILRTHAGRRVHRAHRTRRAAHLSHGSQCAGRRRRLNGMRIVCIATFSHSISALLLYIALECFPAMNFACLHSFVSTSGCRFSSLSSFLSLLSLISCLSSILHFLAHSHTHPPPLTPVLTHRHSPSRARIHSCGTACCWPCCTACRSCVGSTCLAICAAV